MRKMRFLVATGIALCAFSTGCGDDDESDGGATPSVGTCDRRATAEQCIELHDASAIDMENQEEGCLDNGGDWSNDACPTEELIGCCDYVFGNSFHECFYVGYAADPIPYCETDMDGVWTPAS
jgi:hypothetical protein